uniref:Uncharacterized protein n=1 Tax=Nelumbo nucifera TaxID=4432 RepID=A0A822XXD4_NELNU|nr:TPA_asm: hypothetical protein HUJ06_025304 [Nelumbo nucifera]
MAKEGNLNFRNPIYSGPLPSRS